MNNLILQIPVKPLSVNAKFTLHHKSRRIIKSNSANKFTKVIEGHLLKYADNIKSFLSTVTRNDALTLELVMYVPKAEFYTKEGKISLTCIDASNALKMLEDIIYKKIGINDGLNVKVSSEKRPADRDEWLTLITITRIAKPKVCHLDSIAWAT